MDLQMNTSLAQNYTSRTQKIRILSEEWVGAHVFCPCCGNPTISHFPNNKPVADFFCPICNEEFELKSKSGEIANTVADGAYKTMISRIRSDDNPNFFFMSYRKKDLKVQNLIIVPKHFFVASIIEKRKPLAETAHRAGWVGCNILLKRIPETGKIYLIKDEQLFSVSEVVRKYQKTVFVSEYKAEKRGWLLDIMNCIERIETPEFSLNTMYTFADELQLLHPNNHYVKDKIRQQLQILRDNGFIEFCGRGLYRKLL